ncbi:hypothetical protein [Amycolatopsis sp. DG1A-15b]|uniref:hypothetical protein n=1 Tax=Amycolatopsis sp. DG1A-15b TaxID=3052846 RepID=UPI003340F4D2
MRGELTELPVTVAVDGEPALPVISWAGPWLHRPTVHAGNPPGAAARVQMVLADSAADRNRALILAVTIGQNPQWTVEGIYD